MSARDRYRTATAFRAALEERLRAEAHTTGVPLYRLRKEAAFHRLLARLHHVAPQVWVLKGGLALIARLGVQVRATKDADANWRATRQELEEALNGVGDVDLDDWFVFDVGDAVMLQGEGDEGAIRYSVAARMDGRLFEQLILDVNVVGQRDPRPTELVRTERNLFAFVDERPLEILMVTPPQQLAEKLHAYTRWYDGEPSSRAKDLFDMLVIAEEVQLPNGAALTDAVKQTFEVRGTEWPPKLAVPPPSWAAPWRIFIGDYPLRWSDVEAAYAALSKFWEPLLNGTANEPSAHWQPVQWEWT